MIIEIHKKHIIYFLIIMILLSLSFYCGYHCGYNSAVEKSDAWDGHFYSESYKNIYGDGKPKVKYHSNLKCVYITTPTSIDKFVYHYKRDKKKKFDYYFCNCMDGEKINICEAKIDSACIKEGVK